MLRRRDSGESDRRLTLLTRERGKLDVIAKGARKAGSRLAGSSDPLVSVTLGLATGKKNLFVTQAQPATSFPGLRTDYDRLSSALALVELVGAVVPYEQADPAAFEQLLESLTHLERHQKPVVALVWAELRLLAVEGYQPLFDRSALSESPIGEPEPWLSPTAGGYVTPSESLAFGDRFQARAEALIGLAKAALLDAPPPALRYAEECLAALLPFWRHIAEMQLPANESWVRDVRHRATPAVG